MTTITAPTVAPASGNRLTRLARFARRNPTMLLGGAILIFFLGVAVIGLGIVIMIVQAIRRPAFFRGETLSLDAPASVRPKR